MKRKRSNKQWLIAIKKNLQDLMVSHWLSLRGIGDLKEVLDEFYSNGVINAITNETYICLIPKKMDYLKVSNYRPISLITGLYKIISKY